MACLFACTSIPNQPSESPRSNTLTFLAGQCIGPCFGVSATTDTWLRHGSHDSETCQIIRICKPHLNPTASHHTSLHNTMASCVMILHTTTSIVTHIFYLTRFHQPVPTLAGQHHLVPTPTSWHQSAPSCTGSVFRKVYKESYLRLIDPFS